MGFENHSVKEFLNEPKYTIGDETISSRVLKHWLIGLIFPKKFQFENKKVRTADINPILYKIARFNRVNRKNKKRDKSKKEDLSRCVPLTIPFSNSFYQNLTDIYSLKELLYNEGVADINGLPLIKPDNSVHSLLPNGY